MNEGNSSSVPDADVGAKILDDVRDVLTRYVVFPDDHAADAATLYAAATHGQRHWGHAPRLVIKSPDLRCGKTRLLEVLDGLTHRPVTTSNISTAALVRVIDEGDPPFLAIDEADQIYAASSEHNAALTGVLNAGFNRGKPYLRYDANSGKIEEMATFCMLAATTKGRDLPDTIEDRAVVFTLQRRKPGEDVAKFREARDMPKLWALREDLSGWFDREADRFAGAEPVMPVEDRAADTWEPLIAVADAAGGEWPERGRAACLALVAAQEQREETTEGAELLADVWDSIGLTQSDVVPTRTIVALLQQREDAPSFYGLLTPRSLSDRLRSFGVRPVRNTEQTARGYRRVELHDAVGRYAPHALSSDGE